MSVWFDFPEMIHGESWELADEVVTLLAEEGPRSARALARRLGRRKIDVLEALRWDPRTERVGQGRGSRWRLAAESPREASWEPIGTGPQPDRSPEPAPREISGRRAESAS